jgi:hypothetical protein
MTERKISLDSLPYTLPAGTVGLRITASEGGSICVTTRQLTIAARFCRSGTEEHFIEGMTAIMSATGVTKITAMVPAPSQLGGACLSPQNKNPAGPEKETGWEFSRWRGHHSSRTE